MVDPDFEVPAHLRRYITEDEVLVVAVRRHPIVVVEPILALLFGLAVAIWISAGSASAAQLVWLLWLGLLVRTLIKVWLWWSDWFVATSSRLFLSYGIFNKRVTMMPLTKVTDMSYNRSIWGRMIGYGQFVMESAGQDQALREVNFLADPDDLYRKICTEIFHRKSAPQPRAPQALVRQRRHRATHTSALEPWESTDDDGDD